MWSICGKKGDVVENHPPPLATSDNNCSPRMNPLATTPQKNNDRRAAPALTKLRKKFEIADENCRRMEMEAQQPVLVGYEQQERRLNVVELLPVNSYGLANHSLYASTSCSRNKYSAATANETSGVITRVVDVDDDGERRNVIIPEVEIIRLDEEFYTEQQLHNWQREQASRLRNFVPHQPVAPADTVGTMASSVNGQDEEHDKEFVLVDDDDDNMTIAST